MNDGETQIKIETSPGDVQEEGCANCGSTLVDKYCGVCGQKNDPLRQPLGHFLREAFLELFGFDGRLWRSTQLLFFRPGRLTTAYLEGHRVRYIRPLRIYLITSILFFFLLTLIDPVAQVNFGDEEAIPVDSTVSVAQYLESLEEQRNANEERVAVQTTLVDSLTMQFAEDSLAFEQEKRTAGTDSVKVEQLEELEDALDDLLDDRDDETGDLRRLRRRMDLQNKELNWLAQQVEGSSADSMVHPADLARAAELVFEEAPSENVQIGFPDWWPQSESVKRLRNARTNDEIKTGFAMLLADTLRRIPTVMFALLPIFAFLLKGLYLRRQWYYSEHLVFGLHTHAFAFFIFTLMLLLSQLNDGDVLWAKVMMIVFALTIPVYFYVAQKHVYGQGWVKTAFKAWVLGWLYLFVLIGGLVLALLLAASL